MKLTSTKEILLDAQKNKYGVPAFNIHTLEILQGVLEGAQELKSPIIVATTPGTVKYIGLDYLVALFKVAAEKQGMPIAFHLDHCEDVELIKECIKAGYKSVMIDASSKSYEKNINITKEVVDFAHKYEATVEAELGRLAGTEDDIRVEEKSAMLTDPNKALEFVEKTGVDSLAVAIGTAHGLYKAKPEIDFERLKEIEGKVDVPLVLHGASGVPEEDVEKTISYGICKVNISTELKVPYQENIREYLNKYPEEYDPRKYLTSGKEGVKEVVKNKIKMCGSENKGL